MKTAQESYAIAHFAELLMQVEHGETIEVAREGRTLARLVPGTEPELLPSDPAAVQHAIEELRKLPRVPLPEGVSSIRDLINEGRGY